MATTNKGLSQPAAGTSSWDVPLNANFGYIDSALGGTTTKSVTGVTATPVLLTDAEYRSLILNFTGTLTANVTYQIPSGVGGSWIVSNNTSGAFTITISNVAAGASAVVPAGARQILYSDGTNIHATVVTSITGGTISGGTITGTAVSGGTINDTPIGATTAATVRGTTLTATVAVQSSSYLGPSGSNTATINGIFPTDTAGVRSTLNAAGSAPLYACRAWVNFNGVGAVAIRASGNVSSITDNGIGDYTVNFTTAMQDANYAVLGMARRDGIDEPGIVVPVTYLSGSIRINTGSGSFNRFDSNFVNVAIFR